jgi:hypothetical protein
VRQHLVDLLPDSVRTRSEAGMVIGRYVSIGVIVVIVLVALSTHAHFRLERVESAYNAAEEKSRLVLAVEAEAKRLRESLSGLAHSIRQYDRVAPSLRMMDLQSLVVSQLPLSVTLESMDLEVVQGQPAFDPRIKETAKAAPRREIRGELTGFARSDADIAELVTRLDGLTPLKAVSVDFSKSRSVRERQAREFRLSFRVDLENVYEVTYLEPNGGDRSRIVTGEEVGDVE